MTPISGKKSFFHFLGFHKKSLHLYNKENKSNNKTDKDHNNNDNNNDEENDEDDNDSLKDVDDTDIESYSLDPASITHKTDNRYYKRGLFSNLLPSYIPKDAKKKDDKKTLTENGYSILSRDYEKENYIYTIVVIFAIGGWVCTMLVRLFQYVVLGHSVNILGLTTMQVLLYALAFAVIAHRLIAYIAGLIIRIVLRNQMSYNGKYDIHIGWISYRGILDRCEVVIHNLVWRNPSEHFHRSPYILHVKEVSVSIRTADLIAMLRDPYNGVIKVHQVLIDTVEVFIEKSDSKELEQPLNVFCAMQLDQPVDISGTIPNIYFAYCTILLYYILLHCTTVLLCCTSLFVIVILYCYTGTSTGTGHDTSASASFNRRVTSVSSLLMQVIRRKASMGILTKITGGGGSKSDDYDPAADEAEEALKDPTTSNSKKQAKKPGLISLFTSSVPAPPVFTDTTDTSVPPPPPPVSAPDNETQPESTTGEEHDPKQEPTAVVTAGTVPVVASETVTVGAVDKPTTDATEETTRAELYTNPTDTTSDAPPTTDTTTATNTTTTTIPIPAPTTQDAPPVHFILPTLPEILDMFFDYSARLIDVHRLQCFNIVIHPLDLLTGAHVDDSKHSDITIPSLYMSHKDLTRAPLKKGAPRRPITVGKLDHGHWLIICRRSVCFVVAFVINIIYNIYTVGKLAKRLVEDVASSFVKHNSSTVSILLAHAAANQTFTAISKVGSLGVSTVSGVGSVGYTAVSVVGSAGATVVGKVGSTLRIVPQQAQSAEIEVDADTNEATTETKITINRPESTIAANTNATEVEVVDASTAADAETTRNAIAE